MSKCSSCDAEIEWVVTAVGRNMPLDPEPRPDGNIIKVGEINFHGTTTARVENIGAQETLAGEPRFVSHFATCPHAEEHRK